MRFNNTLKTCFMILALLLGQEALIAQNQFAGKPGGNAQNFFSTTPFGNQLGHQQDGSFGSFGANDRWIGIGQPFGVPGPVYGMRIQDKRTQASFSLNGNSLKNLEIQWGSNRNSRLNFNFASSNTSKYLVMSLNAYGQLDVYNRVRAYTAFNNSNNYTEMGHGGSAGYINAKGAGGLDFRLDGSFVYRITDSKRLGLGTAAPAYKLDVFGQGRFTQGVVTGSDRRFKQNIQPLADAVERLLKVEGKSYEFKKEQIGPYDFTEADDKTQLGFLAQDLKKVFPELVYQSEDGYYAVRYEGLIPVLVEGFKEQNLTIIEQEQVIENLNQKVDDLDRQLKELTAVVQQMQKGNTANSSTATLKQNRPNPFNGMTTIDYALPASVNDAELIVYSLDGKQLASYAISAPQGTVEIDAKVWNNGMYIYTLVADGKQLAQQKMVIQR